MALTTAWSDTGALRTRVGWFGLVYRQREQSRTVYVGTGQGHSPGDWREDRRWIGDRRGTLVELRGWHPPVVLPAPPRRAPPSSADE